MLGQRQPRLKSVLLWFHFRSFSHQTLPGGHRDPAAHRSPPAHSGLSTPAAPLAPFFSQAWPGPSATQAVVSPQKVLEGPATLSAGVLEPRLRSSDHTPPASSVPRAAGHPPPCQEGSHMRPRSPWGQHTASTLAAPGLSACASGARGWRHGVLRTCPPSRGLRAGLCQTTQQEVAWVRTASQQVGGKQGRSRWQLASLFGGGRTGDWRQTAGFRNQHNLPCAPQLLLRVRP